MQGLLHYPFIFTVLIAFLLIENVETPSGSIFDPRNIWSSPFPLLHVACAHARTHVIECKNNLQLKMHFTCSRIPNWKYRGVYGLIHQLWIQNILSILCSYIWKNYATECLYHVNVCFSCSITVVAFDLVKFEIFKS